MILKQPDSQHGLQYAHPDSPGRGFSLILQMGLANSKNYEISFGENVSLSLASFSLSVRYFGKFPFIWKSVISKTDTL